MLFFGQPTPEQAVERVAARGREGGHNIPSDMIRRRYANGIKNFTTLYTPVCDYWTIYNNSSVDGIRKVAWGINKEIKQAVGCRLKRSRDRNTMRYSLLFQYSPATAAIQCQMLDRPSISILQLDFNLLVFGLENYSLTIEIPVQSYLLVRKTTPQTEKEFVFAYTNSFFLWA